MPTATTTNSLFQIQPRSGVNTAANNTATFLQDLHAALAGGDKTYDFFSGDFAALHNLMGVVATGGDEVWLDGQDSEGMPVSYVALGNDYVTVSHSFTDKSPMAEGTGSKDTIKPVGVTTVTFTTDQNTSQLVVNDISYGGEALSGILTIGVLAQVAKSLIKSVCRFIASLARRLYARIAGGGNVSPDEAEKQASNDAKASAADAEQEGAEVADGLLADVTLSVAEKAFFAVGIVIAVIVFILQMMEKEITAFFRFYNQTSTNVNFGVGMVADGTGMQVRQAAVGTTVPVSKVAKPSAPPGVIPSDTAIYYSEATFINTFTLGGIGYVVEAPASGDFPGFRALVNVQPAAPNSLYIELAEDDCSKLWDKWSDVVNRDTGLTATASSGRYTLSIATNANQGRSPNPYDGTEGYNYEHLLVLTDGSVQ